MNKTFDKNRFWTLLKWDVLMNKKFYFQMGIGLMVALAFIFCIQTWSSHAQIAAMGNDAYLAHYSDMVIFVEFVAIMAAASYMFHNMATKEQRILFLMQPASNLEKYLARFVSLSAGVLIITNLSIIAADLIHQLFCLIIGSDLSGSIVLHMPGFYETPDSQPGRLFTFYANGEPVTFPSFVQEYASFLFIAGVHSFYAFCGSLFRRNAWLLAICSSFVLTFLFALVMFKLVEWELIDSSMFSTEASIKALFYSILAIGTLITAALYWLSYKIFTRMQVVNNKWLNL